MVSHSTPQWRLRSCPQCHGDMFREDSALHRRELAVSVEWVCLLCGCRIVEHANAPAPLVPASELAR